MVKARVNRQIVTESIFIQMAVSSVLSEAGSKDFRKAIDRLSED